MPEISLYAPNVLSGVIEKLTQPTDYTWLGSVPTATSPFPVAQWEVIRGSRMISKPNTPNAEAHIVPRMGRSQETASFIYVREKKVLTPTTMYWLRAPGTKDNVEQAEKAVMREVKDLNQRVDNLQEWALWQALQGQITLDTPDVSAVVDYKMPTSHKATPTTGWATADFKQIMADVTAIKRLINRDGKVKATDAYAAPETLDLIAGAFTATGSGSMLTDRMKDQYYTTGTIPGFLQLNWHPVDETYDIEGSDTSAAYLPSNKVIFGNFKDNRPVELQYGPTADTEARQGQTGKFSKSWDERDPSGRVVLIELNFLPVVTRPEQIVVATVG